MAWPDWQWPPDFTTDLRHWPNSLEQPCCASPRPLVPNCLQIPLCVLACNASRLYFCFIVGVYLCNYTRKITVFLVRSDISAGLATVFPYLSCTLSLIVLYFCLRVCRFWNKLIWFDLTLHSYSTRSDDISKVSKQTILHLLCHRPLGGGIKRWWCLTSDVRLSDVCLSCTSGLSRKQRGLERLKLAQKYSPRHTWLGHHFQGQKVKGQGHEGRGILCRPPAQIVNFPTTL